MNTFVDVQPTSIRMSTDGRIAILPEAETGALRVYAALTTMTYSEITAAEESTAGLEQLLLDFDRARAES